jgi:hypothetical protein
LSFYEAILCILDAAPKTLVLRTGKKTDLSAAQILLSSESSEYRPRPPKFCCARISVTSQQQVMEYRHV